MESISSTGLKESRTSGAIITAIAAWGVPPICPVEGAGEVEPCLERPKGHLCPGPPVTCPTNLSFVKDKLENTPQDQIRPRPLVTGRDLIERGWTPGPHFGAALQAVEDAQLEGELRTREDAISFLESNFPDQHR